MRAEDGPREGAHRVFVYGTLLRGCSNEWAMATDRSPVRGTLRGHDLWIFGLPTVVETGGEGSVVGEVHEVDDAFLAKLDRFEGHPGFYARKPVEVELEDGTIVSAWTYFFAKFDPTRGDEGTKIVGGSYRAHVATSARGLS